MDHLHRLTIGLAESGAQGLVTFDQRREAGLQGIDVQRALKAQCQRHVVGRAVGIQLPEEQLALLGIRQPQWLIARHVPEGRRRGTAGALHIGDEVGQQRCLEQRTQGQFDLQLLA
ncbi:hypothetical protein D3C77_639160 [compost metagenome]